MKNVFKVLGVIALAAVIGFSMVSCKGDDDEEDKNNGETWTKVKDSTFGTDTIRAIVYGGGKFVAGGNNGKIAYSSDGASWTAVDTGTIFDYLDGTTPRKGNIQAIAYGSGKFVAVSYSGKMAYSSDGATWTAVVDSTFGTDNILGIASSGINFVAVGYNGKMATSADGITWIAKTGNTFGGASSRIYSIAYGGATGQEKFVAVGAGPNVQGARIAYSSDGATWTRAAEDITFRSWLTSIGYGNGKFFVCGSQDIATSPDGVTWTNESGISFNAIAYGNGKYVAVSNYSSISTSPDGVTWTEVENKDNKFDTNVNTTISAVAYGGGKFVAGGEKGQMAYLSW